MTVADDAEDECGLIRQRLHFLEGSCVSELQTLLSSRLLSVERYAPLPCLPEASVRLCFERLSTVARSFEIDCSLDVCRDEVGCSLDVRFEAPCTSVAVSDVLAVGRESRLRYVSVTLACKSDYRIEIAEESEQQYSQPPLGDAAHNSHTEPTSPHHFSEPSLLMATLLLSFASGLHRTAAVFLSLVHSLLNTATLPSIASGLIRTLPAVIKNAECKRGYRRLSLSLLVLVCLCGSGRTYSTIAIRGTVESDQTITVPLKGSPNTGYSAEIIVGAGGNQMFGVLIDTGSSNLAIAGENHPDLDKWFHTNESSSFEGSGRTVSVTYTEGEWRGELGRDVVRLGGSEEVEVNLVVISYAEGFYIRGAPWQGILGMAYSALAKPDSSTETFWDSFRPAVGLRDVFSLQFCPPIDVPVLDITESKGGTMVLGGISGTLYRGNIIYTPIVEEQFYNVLISNISVGDTAIDLHCREFNNDKTIVDSGTTDIFFNEQVFDKIVEVFSASLNATPLSVPDGFWVGNARLAWPVDDIASVYSVFPTLYLSFAVDGNETQAFSLAVTPQIYLRQVGGTTEEQIELQCFPECDFFQFGIKKRQRGTVIGGNVMLGFVTVFDRENKRIGFAKTTCQQQKNSGVPHIVGPFPQDPIDCACPNCGPGLQYWEIISYSSTSVVSFIAIAAIVLAIHSKIRKRYRSRGCHYDWVIVVRNRCLCCCGDGTVQERSRGIEEGTPFVGSASATRDDASEDALEMDG